MIIIILSLIIDHYINYFFPMIKSLFFVSTLIVYLINNKKYKKIVLISSCVYDIFFGKTYFLYLLNFYIIEKEIKYLTNKLNKCFITYILIYLISLIVFILLKYLILSILGYIYLKFILKEIIIFLLINIIYSLILYFILGIKRKSN